MPHDLSPMLATLVQSPAEGDDWFFEVKWDGYRALAYCDGKKIDLRSRNNLDFSKKFYRVAESLQELSLNAVLDGEIIVSNDQGISNFGKLQNWRSDADGQLLYYVFDVLWANGQLVTGLPLTERRSILEQLVPEDPVIRLSEIFNTKGEEFLEAAKQLKLEGIIAKRKASFYYPGNRTKEWLKIKVSNRQEVVIGGFSKNEGSSKTFSALLVGVYHKGKLRYTGKVGTGFSSATQKEMMKKFQPLITTNIPFDKEPDVNKPSRFRPHPPRAKATWLKPTLVCEVSFTEMTSEGIMRHPSFEGMRIDKSAKDVISERPVKVDKKKSGKITGKDVVKKVETGRKNTLLNPNENQQVKVIQGRELKFTNVQKLYWSKEKITKGDMINYYYSVVPQILPFMKDRPQSLNRHPNGVNGESFYQKNIAGKFPSWLKTHDYENTSSEGKKKFLVCADQATLLYMANLGCIEMNPWHSRIQDPDKPDWSVIDLDPDTNSFEQVIEVANVVNRVLKKANIMGYPKTSGSTGIHIYIPLGGKYDYEQSKMLAQLIVTIVHKEIPEFTSLERTPSKRKGLIYLDFLQNRSIQTIAAPFSLRPKPGAPVSMPLDWAEIKQGLKVSDFNIYNAAGIAKERFELFKPVLGKGIDLAKVIRMYGE